MNLRVFVFAAIAAMVIVHAEVTYIDPDQVEPFPQPTPKTDSEKAAVKFKPQLIVSYGCHPYPAVQADGSVSNGMKGKGECQGSASGSQVYARSKWYNDKWAIMYAWYLPKGRYSAALGVAGKYKGGQITFKNKQRKAQDGDRHFWEVTVVWVDNPVNSTVLGVSMNLGRNLETEVPVATRHLDGSSVKLDSYNGRGFPKPRLQLTEERGEFQDLITWEQLTDEARDALSDAEFGGWLMSKLTTKRDMPLKDGIFEERLEDAWPF
ncbi:Necrosis inducing protein NPP1 [Phytophthora megakarya]|uniref:Necrosis inducing protein NPP1 n=1 Tax=Phytophthora megakarya TaxID=4795 RepID=A0A225V319_9STRA|nr:Necrosis inducing protein NPP1 [Phytophthora megakarya]